MQPLLLLVHLLFSHGQELLLLGHVGSVLNLKGEVLLAKSGLGGVVKKGAAVIEVSDHIEDSHD